MHLFYSLRFPLLLVLSLVSCKDGRTVFEEHKEIPDMAWSAASPVTFQVPISDNSRPLELAIALRHAASFAYSDLLVRITETGPDGATVIRDEQIPVRSETELYGDASGDIVDLEYVFDTGRAFPALGTYSFRIEHTMPADPVQMAMEVGLIVRKTTED